MKRRKIKTGRLRTADRAPCNGSAIEKSTRAKLSTQQCYKLGYASCGRNRFVALALLQLPLLPQLVDARMQLFLQVLARSRLGGAKMSVVESDTR